MSFVQPVSVPVIRLLRSNKKTLKLTLNHVNKGEKYFKKTKKFNEELFKKNCLFFILFFYFYFVNGLSPRREFRLLKKFSLTHSKI